MSVEHGLQSHSVLPWWILIVLVYSFQGNPLNCPVNGAKLNLLLNSTPNESFGDSQMIYWRGRYFGNNTSPVVHRRKRWLVFNTGGVVKVSI